MKSRLHEEAAADLAEDVGFAFQTFNQPGSHLSAIILGQAQHVNQEVEAEIRAAIEWYERELQGLGRQFWEQIQVLRDQRCR